jgi:hypothetical protein
MSGLPTNWPLDEKGNPLALVTMTLEEKIGLPNYSNVTVGPATVYRFVKDDENSRQQGLRECSEDCEYILAYEREPVLKLIEGGA